MSGASSKTSESSPAVCFEDATVRYGDVVAVEKISFDVAAGSAAAIIGPNGSGKTTIIRALLGLVPLSGGKVSVFGKPVAAVRHRVGYVPQKFDFEPDFPVTVREFMHLAAPKEVGSREVEKKIKEVGLMPAVLDRRLGSLSGGQLQRVLVARAVLGDPELLVLDEPATGIDVVGEATFYDAIRHLKEEHGTTILLVSHDLAMVSNFVDQVICVNRKLMCSGPPSHALTEELLADLFGRRAAAYGHPGHGKTTHAHRSKHR